MRNSNDKKRKNKEEKEKRIGSKIAWWKGKKEANKEEADKSTNTKKGKKTESKCLDKYKNRRKLWKKNQPSQWWTGVELVDK